MESRRGVKLRILSRVYDKMSSDCQDAQMGLGEKYFDDLIDFAVDEAEKEFADCTKDDGGKE